MAPAAAVTRRVEPETLTAAVWTVKEREAGVGSRLPGRVGGPDVEGMGAVRKVRGVLGELQAE